jgi:uncharacterized cupredoxin-like copper-binding protein
MRFDPLALMIREVFKMSRVKTFSLVLLFAALGMLVLSACAGSASANNQIDAELTTYKINLSKTSAPAGQVIFHVKNTATDMKHEFVVFKTDLDAANLPLDSDGNVAEDQLQKVDEIELDPSKSGDLTVNLPAGHYAIICNQPGHYKQGMYTNFTTQ